MRTRRYGQEDVAGHSWAGRWTQKRARIPKAVRLAQTLYETRRQGSPPIFEVRMARLTATTTEVFARRATTPVLTSPKGPEEGNTARSVSPATIRYLTTARSQKPGRGAPPVREVVSHEAEEQGREELGDIGRTEEREEHQVQVAR